MTRPRGPVSTSPQNYLDIWETKTKPLCLCRDLTEPRRTTYETRSFSVYFKRCCTSSFPSQSCRIVRSLSESAWNPFYITGMSRLNDSAAWTRNETRHGCGPCTRAERNDDSADARRGQFSSIPPRQSKATHTEGRTRILQQRAGYLW